MSSSSDNSKLVVTAIGAAVAGAAIGVAAMKFSKHKSKNESIPPSQGRSHKRSTFIYEDSSEASRNAETLIFPHNHEERMRRRIAARAAVEEDNFVPRNSVTVRVPATSANMGPGCK